MKKTINKMVFGSFLSLALVACVDDFEYTPAPAEDAGKVYVRADETAPRNLDIDGANIKVPFVRTDAAGAMDITVALTDTSGLFKLENATVSFAAGETTANAEVSYSYDALDPAAEYAITVAITAGEVSQYTSPALPMTCKKAWQNLGMAQFYEGFWFGKYIGANYIFEKQLLKAPDGTETYKLVDPWDKATSDAIGYDYFGPSPDFVFYIDEEGYITYPDVELGISPDGARTVKYWYPAGVIDADVPANKMIMENVAQIVWVPLFSNNSWFGQSFPAYISFPGGPDLAELLGL